MKKPNKLHIRKGDTVILLAGNDKGKKGKVMQVVPAKNKAIVEGINIQTKHEKPSAEKPEGGRKKIEGYIHLSNLMLVDPATGNPTRIGRKRNEQGKWQRCSKKTGEFITP